MWFVDYCLLTLSDPSLGQNDRGIVMRVGEEAASRHSTPVIKLIYYGDSPLLPPFPEQR